MHMLKSFSIRWMFLLMAVTAASGLLQPLPVQAQTATTPASIGLDAAISTTSNGKAATADNYTAYPVLNVGAVPPLVMFVMSRDEQLYIKAYTDYTDLDGDGRIDTTYNNKFDYAGYFDSTLCYGYASGQYKAEAAATDHQCSGDWSGNFLNWLTMSRLDIVRLVLYGGLRHTDTATKTVLERAAIPNDVHAWSKVYDQDDIDKYTPFSGTVTFCNASFNNNSGYAATPPELRVASGNWSQWSSTERQQCVWHEDHNSSSTPADDPYYKSNGLGDKNYYVRVEVCDNSDPTLRESFCRKYKAPDGTVDYKPAGLLQQYGESGEMRFGLMTGSFAQPRSGGRLRANIGLFAGNGSDPTACTGSDEVKLADGTFCNDGSGDEGIINTLNRLQIPGWYGNGNPGQGDGWRASFNGSEDCWEWGTIQRADTTNLASTTPGHPNGVLDNPGGGKYHCEAWGNPLTEIYAEALRYIEGNGASATKAFETGDDSTWIPGIPDHIGWKDPYRTTSGGNPYCAQCSIIVLSTGLNSFDSDEIPKDGNGIDAASATDEVGADEGLNGQYLIGRVLGENGSPSSLALNAKIDTAGDVCSAKTLTGNLSDAIGICPDVPSLEGSYDIAGLAFKAWTTDMRPDLSKPSGYKNTVQTYAVQLAESLPTFNIPVSGGTISFSPVCLGNPNGGKSRTDPGYHSCDLASINVGTLTASASAKYTYGRPLLADDSAGSYLIDWEDSTFGSDHDMDEISMITYCVGSACEYTDGQTKKNLDGTTYTGYDICWRSDSSICTSSNGKPTVADNQVLIRTEVLATSTGDTMITGYSLAGTQSSDGIQKMVRATSGFYSAITSNNNPPTACKSGTSTGCWDLPKVAMYSAGTSSVKRLQNPLFYAAKYGGFTDLNNNGKPDMVSEWDQVNNDTGAAGPDGQPDNFFLVRNPAQLGARLSRAFTDILKRSGSGTAAAVVSNSANGVGLTYQALYQAERKDSAGRSVEWSGTINGLWTDSYGYLREDLNHNDVLDSYDVDPVVEFHYNASNNEMEFYRELMPTTGGKAVTTFDKSKATVTSHPLDDLQTVWSAQNQLWDTSFSTGVDSGTLESTNRTYTDNSKTGRYIFTWIDKNHDGKVESGEQVPFTFTDGSSGNGFYGNPASGSSPASGNFRYLNTADPEVAKRIVAWVRGAELDEKDSQGNPLWRNRTIDYNNDGTQRVLRLGDIVNSTPVVVGTPSEAFDLLYNDTSYGSFRDYYRDRRQVVYVGANDGMLHAFNGGFFNAQDHSIQTTPTDTPAYTTNTDPLGGELWAYVPGNLLPHLRWLADPEYKHNFYVDGSPIAQDVKIFTGSCVTKNPCVDAEGHVDGWGTILIVPFRFGGGPISVNTEPDSTQTASYQNSYSAYVVLDVTNPEQPPKLLAELTNTETSSTTDVPATGDIGNVTDTYTSSVPAVAVFRNPTTGDPNGFFLFTGSGTTDNGGVGSTEGGRAVATTDLKIRAYDLSKVASGDATPARTFDFANVGTTGSGTSSFAGDLIASDFNLDGIAEGLYFGSVKDNGAGSAFGGELYKINFNGSADPTTWTSSELIKDLDLPVVAHPTLGRNDHGAPMVFVGTGRVFTKEDLASTTQQKVLGVIDTSLLDSSDTQHHTLPLSMSDLVDVSKIGVKTDSTVSNGGTNGAGDTIGNFSQLLASFDESGRLGWYFDLSAPTSATDTTPSERVVAAQSLLGGVLLTTTFQPGTDACTDVGSGKLYATNYKTGTADPNLQLFGTQSDKTTLNKSTELGPGLPASPSLHVGSGSGQQKLTACVQTSTGAIICKDITTLKSVLSGEVSWRQPLDK